MDNTETRSLISFDIYHNRVEDTKGTIDTMNNNFGLLYDEIQKLKLENQNIKNQLNELKNKQSIKSFY